MRTVEYSPNEQIGAVFYLYDVWDSIYRKAAFRCTCGKIFSARIDKVRRFETISCGCKVGKNPNSRNHTTHGGRKLPLYSVWCAMKARCYNKKRTQYKDYGGKGVIVCEEWKKDFKAFYNWAINNGWKKGLQLDKDIKGDGLLYSPETCCFVTPKNNSNKRRNNKILLHNGQSKTASEWAAFYNIKYQTFLTRLNRGWSFEETVFGKSIKN
jgi:hypothetical protein